MMNKSFLIIINEQHKLLESQRKPLESLYGEIREENFVKVPATGWSLAEMNTYLKEWLEMPTTFIFISPIPYLIRELAKMGRPVRLFHNDHREKVELPDGRIIHKLSEEGWQLV